MGATKMIVLNTKTFDELRTEATADLQAVGFNTSPGAVAKLFMNIVNKQIANLYDTLTVNHLRAFVTTADGAALDEIGLLLQCFRMENEDDENYRYRITQQCLVLATSNETAVRLTVLTTEGVEDVVLKPYGMGAGTFVVIIIPSANSDVNEVKLNVKTRLLDIHGYGIRYAVETPRLNYVKIKHHLYINDRCSDNEKQEIRYNCQIALTEYFNNLKIGEAIMVDKITQICMNISTNIIQEANVSFFINGEKAIYTNQSSRWFEKFVLSSEIDNVVIT